MLLLVFVLSRLINGCFKNFFTRVISLSVMGCIICFVFSNNIKKDVLFVFLLSLALSISIKRVSDSFVLSLVTGHLSMSLKHPEEYRRHSYQKEKDIISERLQREFILGIIEASKFRRKLRFTTHTWFIKNVVLKEEIKEKFSICIKNKRQAIVAAEVLSLFSKEEAFINSDLAIKSAMKKRKSYGVTLERKY